MRDYRLYLLDSTGHIRRAVELACDDDEDAVARADAARQGLPAELWQRARFLRVFEGSRPRSAFNPRDLF
jgi:hypothetical protein